MVCAGINIASVDNVIYAIFISPKPGILLRIWWTRHAVTNPIDRGIGLYKASLLEVADEKETVGQL